MSSTPYAGFKRTEQQDNTKQINQKFEVGDTIKYENIEYNIVKIISPTKRDHITYYKIQNYDGNSIKTIPIETIDKVATKIEPPTETGGKRKTRSNRKQKKSKAKRTRNRKTKSRR